MTIRRRIPLKAIETVEQRKVFPYASELARELQCSEWGVSFAITKLERFITFKPLARNRRFFWKFGCPGMIGIC